MQATAFWFWLESKKPPRVYQLGAIVEYLGLLGFDISTHKLSHTMLGSYKAVYSHWAWTKWGRHTRRNHDT